MKKDYDHIAAVEKAIAEKYGKDAAQDIRGGWGEEKEKEYLNRFRFEFFAINAGSKTFKGEGQSLKKTSTNVQRRGTAYKIYGCGYFMPAGDAGYSNPEILIPLESVVVLST